MKNFIIVLLSVFLLMGFYPNKCEAQVELKGVKLGEVTDSLVNGITLGGKEGAIYAYSVNDGRSYMVIFSPDDRYWKDDVDILQSGIEKKYGITFKKIKDGYSYSLKYEINGVKYLILADHNRYMSPRYKVTLYLINNELYDLNKQEDKAKASSDF